MHLAAMPIVSAASTLIGTGISAFSQYQQGKAEKKMANYNAKLAEQEAANEARTTSENVMRQREMNRRQLSTMRSKMAGAGVSMTQGSSLDVFGAAVSDYETQVLDLFREGEMKQVRLHNEASMSRYQGKQAMSAGKIGAVGSLIGGAGRAGTNYYQMR